MTELRVIDADTHVDESEATWEYIDSVAIIQMPPPTQAPTAPVGGSLAPVLSHG